MIRYGYGGGLEVEWGGFELNLFDFILIKIVNEKINMEVLDLEVFWIFRELDYSFVKGRIFVRWKGIDSMFE